MKIQNAGHYEYERARMIQLGLDEQRLRAVANDWTQTYEHRYSSFCDANLARRERLLIANAIQRYNARRRWQDDEWLRVNLANVRI